MKIVAFVGLKGSGKDASADLLKKAKRSKGKVSFAKPLKEICSKVFKIPMNYFEQVELKEKKLETSVSLTPRILKAILRECERLVPPIDGDIIKYRPSTVTGVGLLNRTLHTPREILQVVGSEFIRDQVYENFHIEAAFTDFHNKTEGLYCVTDCRFPNEYEYLKNTFGEDLQAFYLERDSELYSSGDVHQSEQNIMLLKEAMPEDSVVDNSGTLDDLKKKLLSLVPVYKPTGKRRGPKKTINVKNSKTIQAGRFGFVKR